MGAAFLRRAAIGCVAMASALAIAACGGDDEPESAGSGAAATTTEQSAAGSGPLADAEKVVAAATDVSKIEVPMPTEAFDPGKKRIALISVGLNSPVGVLESEFAKEAVEAIGWEASPIFDSKRDPAQTARFVTQAVQQGYDAILLQHSDVNNFAGPVKEALAKGVAIGCIFCDSGELRGEVLDSGIDADTEGDALAAKVAIASEGKGKVLVYRDRGYALLEKRTGGFIENLKKYCPGCEIIEEYVASTDLAQPGPPYYTAALSKHPKGEITDVIAPYGAGTIAYAQTSQQRGRTEIRIHGYDGALPEINEMMKGDEVNVDSTIFSPFEFAVWGALDLVARQLADKEPWEGVTSMPMPLMTKDNIDQFPGDGSSPAFGVDFKAKFQELWGK